MYPDSYRIKALLQGADSLEDDKITYEGDSSVIVDKNKINIQIHYISPGYTKGKQEMPEKAQYMFAIYLPKGKGVFCKGVINMVQSIKEAIATTPEDGLLYLANKLTDKAGFFISNKHLLYVVSGSRL